MNSQKYQIEELKKMEAELLSTGMPRYKAHYVIGQRLGGLSRVTIYRHLVPGQ